VTTGTDREPTLRERLKALQSDVDEAEESHHEHLRKHPCRGRCKTARELGEKVADAQYQLGMTRFLNEGD
jgi:hypothetical protein